MNQMSAPDANGQLLRQLLPAVLAAGQLQQRYFRARVAVQTKSDASPVTVADQESERILQAALNQAAPNIPVVAEEAVSNGSIPERLEQRFFLVDPLDGTIEFVNGRPEFTINVAKIEDGIPVFGLIYAPITGEMYATIGLGKAIYANFDVNCGAAAAMAAIDRAAPIAARLPRASGLVAMASLSHMNDATRDYLAAFPIARTMQAGSSLKFCWIAKGAADIYPRLGPTAEWDIAAGHAILRAAGGSVTQLDGAQMHYGKRSERFLNPQFVARGMLSPA